MRAVRRAYADRRSSEGTALESRRVQAGKKTILAIPDRASAVEAVAELIWNGLDADASAIAVSVDLGPLGAPVSLTIADDGVGMSYAKATEVFELHGDSWKADAKFSAQGRPMHGRLGRGRFLAYTLGTAATWETVSSEPEGMQLTRVTGRRSKPDSFDFDGPLGTDKAAGTVLTLKARDVQAVARLTDAGVVEQLTARLAATLFALPEVEVTYRGEKVDPSQQVDVDEVIDLQIDPALLLGHSPPQLRVVEWKKDMGAAVVMLCDEHGSVVTQHKPDNMPKPPIHWSAYLTWEGFSDPDLMGTPDLEYPAVRHGMLLAAVADALASYLDQRLIERKGQIIAEWKAERVYPYDGLPASPTEEVERDLFDIVAVISSPNIGKTVPQKKLSLRLLREAIRAEPSRARHALEAVLDLSDHESEILTGLMDRTTVGSLVRAGGLTADRVDLLRALGDLLYSDATRKDFREVDQLHPMVVREPWLFGDEWELSLSESGLTGVVKSAVARLGKAAEYAPTPVRLESGKQGRVDLVMYRCLPESEATRHLVVELKRPMKVSMTEFGQISNYATTITDHPEVLSATNSWDFWLVCTDMDSAVRNLLNDPRHPGLATRADRYRIWVITWTELLESCGRKLAATQSQLDLVATSETSRAYLRRTHDDLIPEVLRGEE